MIGKIRFKRITFVNIFIVKTKGLEEVMNGNICQLNQISSEFSCGIKQLNIFENQPFWLKAEKSFDIPRKALDKSGPTGSFCRPS